MDESAATGETAEQDSRFKIMADVAPVMIWMAGRDSLCNFFNRPWMDFTGRTMEQELGNGWTEGVHRSDFQHCLDIYLSSFKAHTDFRMEYRLRRHDGEYRWILDTGRPFFDPSGEFSGYIGSCIDITDLKEAQEKNRKLQEQFYQAQKMEAIGSMAAGIAHDLKNLIIVVQGNADLIRSRSGPDTPVYRYADHIFQAASREADMVQKLMLFSRKQPIQHNRLNYGDLSRKIMELISRVIPANIEVTLDASSDLWEVYGDQTLLEQVFVNMVTNARDAMPDGGRLNVKFRNLTITQEYLESNPSAILGDCICMRVADTGTGMSPETLKHIFEPFFTTKPPEKGTGLGLSSVYGIVKEHGGWVEVDSTFGKGSAFSVFLPAHPQ
jgi:two-component system cell cycle sensor histidine kinase/response regulator CckA